MNKIIELTHQQRFSVANSGVFENVHDYQSLEKAINEYANMSNSDQDSKNRMGDAFELYTEFFFRYFDNNPFLGVTSLLDTSKDPYNEGFDFEYTSTLDKSLGLIQSKFKNKPNYKFTKGDLKTFLSECSLKNVNSQSNKILFTNLDKPNVFENFFQIGNQVFRVISASRQEEYIAKVPEFWNDFNATFSSIRNQKITYEDQKPLRQHQIEIVEACQDILDDKKLKGRVIVATGGGKTRCQYELLSKGFFEKNFSLEIIVAPTLALLEQHRNSFAGLFSKNVVEFQFNSNKKSNDQLSENECSTNPEIFYDYVTNSFNKNKKVLVFVTYDSVQKLFETIKEKNLNVELCVWDEFHHLVRQNTNYKEDFLNDLISKRNIFFSASEKSGRVVSSDDEKIFGEKLIDINYARLRDVGILVPKINIKIIWISNNHWIHNKFTPESQFEFEQKKINPEVYVIEATSIALAFRDMYKVSQIVHMVTYSQRVAICNEIVNSEVFKQIVAQNVYINSISAQTPENERKNILQKCASEPLSILAQHSVVKEGIDIASLNCLIFNRQMDLIGTQQSVGRIIRADPRDTAALMRGEISLDNPNGWNKYSATVYIVVNDLQKETFKDIVCDLIEKLQTCGINNENIMFEDVLESRTGFNQDDLNRFVGLPPLGIDVFSHEIFDSLAKKSWIEQIQDDEYNKLANENISNVQLIEELKTYHSNKNTIKFNARAQNANRVLQTLRKDDVLKPVCVPLNQTMIEKFSQIELNKKILVISDVGILTILLSLGHNSNDLLFLCHNQNDVQFANELNIQTILLELNDNFKQNMSDFYNRINQMDFDYIVGNPPYNGILKKDVPQEFDQFLESGYQTYFPFIAMGSKLKKGGKLIFITPQTWLNGEDAFSLRNELLKIGSFDIEIIDKPNEWNVVNTDKLSIFQYEVGKLNETKSVFNGKILNLSKIGNSILEKINNIKEEKIEIFRGKQVKKDNSYEEQNFYNAVGELEIFSFKPNELIQQKINLSQKDEMWILFPEVSHSPFKRSFAKNIKHPIKIIKPTQFSDAYVAISVLEKDIDRMFALLESTTAQFVWRTFYASIHFAKVLNKTFPNILNLLPERFNNEDIYSLFGFNDEEIRHIEELAKTYGKDM